MDEQELAGQVDSFYKDLQQYNASCCVRVPDEHAELYSQLLKNRIKRLIITERK